jgi:hypothetical protein
MKPLYIGEVIDNYCNGHFGSSAFGRKEVVAFGYNWLLCRVYGYDSSYLQVAEFTSQDEMIKYITEWRNGGVD